MLARCSTVLTLLFLLFTPVAFAQCTLNTASPSVTICTPANNASVSSPVHVVAGTTDTYKITVLQIYVDGAKVYQVLNSGTLDTSVTMTDGTHRLVVQAMDSANRVFKSTVYVNVGSTISPGTTQSPIKHLIVLTMQNRSFDHLFGTMAGVNGIKPGVLGYSQVDASGKTVVPFLVTSVSTSDLPHSRQQYLKVWDQGKMDKYAYYNGDLSMGHYDNTIAGVDKLWTWASQYALAENYFPSVMSTAPANPMYLISASDNNYPYSTQPVYGPCNKPDASAKAATWKNVGNQLSAAHVSWTWFAENYGQCGGGYIPQENPFQYFTSTQNSTHIQDLSKFYTALTNGTVPSVTFINPNPNHNGHPGSGSFTTAMNWMDGFIRKIQASSIWPDCAIVILWDESGGWWDHVPPPQIDSQGLGQRVPMIVISPYAKKGHISTVRMDHVSVLKWIQWNWSLGTLNSREGLSSDISDMFTF